MRFASVVLRGLLGVALGLTLTVAAAPSAAAHHACMREREFTRIGVEQHLAEGWKIGRVHRMLDGYRGTVLYRGDGFTDRSYAACSGSGYILRVSDTHHRVIRKGTRWPGGS